MDNVLSFHEPEICPTKSLDGKCMEFKFQTERNYYVDLRHTNLASKLKFVKSRGCEFYNTKEVKKEHKEKARKDEEATVE